MNIISVEVQSFKGVLNLHASRIWAASPLICDLFYLLEMEMEMGHSDRNELWVFI